jgi:hypothetical protein
LSGLQSERIPLAGETRAAQPDSTAAQISIAHEARGDGLESHAGVPAPAMAADARREFGKFK